MNFSYSTFIPSHDQHADANNVRQQLIQQHVKKHGWIELQCDYFGMDSYYYDTKQKIMYRVTNVVGWNPNRDISPVFEVCRDEHILKLNSLM